MHDDLLKSTINTVQYWIRFWQAMTTWLERLNTHIYVSKWPSCWVFT